ncbi:LysE family transporter, partial [Citrobacter braakii]
VLCAAGVGTLVLAVPWLRLGVLGGGAAYLLWLAWRLAGAGTPALGPQPPLRISFARGVALQFLNIKAWTLALSVVAGWIAGHPQAGQRLVWVLP